MNIIDVYEKYVIPLNLQHHMLRVAAVGAIIGDNWQGPLIDEVLVVKTLLLHDMGNIIKFKLDNPALLYPKDRNRIAELREIQQRFINTYGPTCDTATLKIITEITPDNRIVDLCERSHGDELPDIVEGDDWNRKICFYSDMRVGPHGVLPTEVRFDDLIKRYPQDLTLPRNKELTLILESQLQQYCSSEIRTINDGLVEPYLLNPNLFPAIA